MFHTSIAEQRLAAYCRAKDGNRPHLMAQAFADDAWLETAVAGDVYCPPSLAHGREAITRALVRHFGRTCENVCTFCLQRPGARPDEGGSFDCDWTSPLFPHSLSRVPSCPNAPTPPPPSAPTSWPRTATAPT